MWAALREGKLIKLIQSEFFGNEIVKTKNVGVSIMGGGYNIENKFHGVIFRAIKKKVCVYWIGLINEVSVWFVEDDKDNSIIIKLY